MEQIMSSVPRELANIETRTYESRGISTATVSGTANGKNYTVTVKQSPLGKEILATEYSRLDKKSGYKNEVKNLRKEGVRQVDIAARLGISQSMVSKLANEGKK
jgi:DNA-binding Xre family transcriptional regulator